MDSVKAGFSFYVKYFGGYGKSFYICSPNTEMVLWPSG